MLNIAEPAATIADPGRLLARRARIDTCQQPVVYVRSDCAVSRAEGFEAQAQVEVIANGREVLAILHRVEADWLGRDEIALSDAAWNLLALRGGEPMIVRHAKPLESLKFLRAKVYGRSRRDASRRTPLDAHQAPAPIRARESSTTCRRNHGSRHPNPLDVIA